MEVVDNTLGIIKARDSREKSIRNPSQSMAFLFVSQSKQVVGFLLAEIIAKTDIISITKSRSSDSEKPLTERHFERVLHELDEDNKRKVIAGISRIWVYPDYQRKGIASRLVDAMRETFMLPAKILSIGEFAFSHTTPNGSDFAVKYTGSTDFLTYAPALPGDNS